MSSSCLLLSCRHARSPKPKMDLTPLSWKLLWRAQRPPRNCKLQSVNSNDLFLWSTSEHCPFAVSSYISFCDDIHNESWSANNTGIFEHSNPLFWKLLKVKFWVISKFQLTKFHLFWLILLRFFLAFWISKSQTDYLLVCLFVLFNHVFVDVCACSREEHYSSWVFPEWVPSTRDWVPVLQR